jgi:hypothetical protein
LDQSVAELGGQYASIERCLLLASMQRAFVTAQHNDHASHEQLQQQNKGSQNKQNPKEQEYQDPRYYRTPLLGGSGGSNHGNVNNRGRSDGAGSQALQTALAETCLYAARRGTQRAFATGHTGTASAMTNFCVDC